MKIQMKFDYPSIAETSVSSSNISLDVDVFRKTYFDECHLKLMLDESKAGQEIGSDTLDLLILCLENSICKKHTSHIDCWETVMISNRYSQKQTTFKFSKNQQFNESCIVLSFHYGNHLIAVLVNKAKTEINIMFLDSSSKHQHIEKSHRVIFIFQSKFIFLCFSERDE